MKRREFLGTAAAATAGTLVTPGAAPARPAGTKLKVAMVGTGIRGTGMWGRNVVAQCSDAVEFVALCDKNSARLEYAKGYMGVDVPTYTDFDRMVRETRPESIIVTTMDSTHEYYIVRAMELGCDVITEKPMAVTEQQCQNILDTEKRTGRHITVTFNYRYGPDATRTKEILNSGVIGDVTSVDFHWYLDTNHGASYFRRWHAYRKNNGSLWVHKATHHFDLVNWWLDADPVEVFAKGELRKYGRKGPFRHTHCRPCPHKSRCDFSFDLTANKRLMDLYAGAAEAEDGYHRDGCLYREDIDIWDTMAATVTYTNGVMMSYSLNACMPYEGAKVGFNGTRGRLDYRLFHRQPWAEDRLAEIRVTENFKGTKVIDLTAARGGHGGADVPLLDAVFRGTPDPLKRQAGSRAGAYSIMIGIAACHSIDTGRPARIADLVRI